MKSLTITLCALAFQLVWSAQVNPKDEKLKFVSVKMPTSKRTYTKAEFAKIAKQLKPRIDNPKAKKIIQDKNAGKVKKGKWNKQIINGAAAVRGQFPWQVALIMDSSSICGGSLILTNWVLTATHCTYQKTNISVRIGTVDYANIPVGGSVMFTTEKYEHPGYNPTTLENDIALVKLPEHVTISEFVNIIRLPANSDATKTFENANVTVSGFGRTAQNSSASQFMNWIDDKVISNAKCSESFGDLIKATTICTFTPLKSSCQGDSGGPLVTKDSAGTSILIGAVSFGGATCLDFPKGYARTASYLGWMSGIIQQDVSGPEASTTSALPTTATPTTLVPITSTTSALPTTATSTTLVPITSTTTTTTPSTATTTTPQPTTATTSTATQPTTTSTATQPTTATTTATQPTTTATTAATQPTTTGTLTTPQPTTTTTATPATTTGASTIIPSTTAPPTTSVPTSIVPTTSPTATTTATPTSTPSTTTSTTKSPGPTKKTPPPKCSSGKFKPLAACCNPARKEILSIDVRDKSCPGASSKVFNDYYLNERQDPKADFAINYDSSTVQRILYKDACFANCHLKKLGVLMSNGTINETKLGEVMTQTNQQSSWKNKTLDAIKTCSDHVDSNEVPEFVNGKKSCSGEALVMVQCTLMRSLNACDRVTTNKCGPLWTLFDACKKNIFLP